MSYIESCRGPFNNQSLINFLQSLIFPCGTYLGHLLQKFAKICKNLQKLSQFDVRAQLNG